jgi:hypothetical protein
LDQAVEITVEMDEDIQKLSKRHLV